MKGTGRYLFIPNNIKVKSIMKIIEPIIKRKLKCKALKKLPNESSCKPLCIPQPPQYQPVYL